MALRIRKNGEMVCAAQTEPEEGDVYLDDKIHYTLSVKLVVISIWGIREGIEYWKFHKPIELDERIENERKLKTSQ